MNYFPTTQHKKDLFSSSDKTLLKAGRYKATLNRIIQGKGRSYDGKSERSTLTLSFITAEGAMINRTCTASINPSSSLITLLKSMSETQPDNQVLSDPEKCSHYLDSFVGKTFLCQVEPSNNGKFNNLVGLFPEIN